MTVRGHLAVIAGSAPPWGRHAPWHHRGSAMHRAVHGVAGADPSIDRGTPRAAGVAAAPPRVRVHRFAPGLVARALPRPSCALSRESRCRPTWLLPCREDLFGPSSRSSDHQDLSGAIPVYAGPGEDERLRTVDYRR